MTDIALIITVFGILFVYICLLMYQRRKLEQKLLVSRKQRDFFYEIINMIISELVESGTITDADAQYLVATTIEKYNRGIVEGGEDNVNSRREKER